MHVRTYRTEKCDRVRCKEYVYIIVNGVCRCVFGYVNEKSFRWWQNFIFISRLLKVGRIFPSSHQSYILKGENVHTYLVITNNLSYAVFEVINDIFRFFFYYIERIKFSFFASKYMQSSVMQTFKWNIR